MPIHAMMAISERNTSTVITFWIVEEIARSMKPLSLPNASSEPQNDSEPMTPPNIVAPKPSGSGVWPAAFSPMKRANSTVEISAAAPPPQPLRSATICGISVIATKRAPSVPARPPSTMPTMISTPAFEPSFSRPPPQMKMNEATMANAMPIAAS